MSEHQFFIVADDGTTFHAMSGATIIKTVGGIDPEYVKDIAPVLGKFAFRVENEKPVIVDLGADNKVLIELARVLLKDVLHDYDFAPALQKDTRSRIEDFLRQTK